MVTHRSLDAETQHGGGFDGYDVFGRFVRVQHLLLQHEPHFLPRAVYQSLQPAFYGALGFHGGDLQGVKFNTTLLFEQVDISVKATLLVLLALQNAELWCIV